MRGKLRFQAGNDGRSFRRLHGVCVRAIVVRNIAGRERYELQLFEDFLLIQLQGKLNGGRGHTGGGVRLRKVAGADDTVTLMLLGGHINPAVRVGCPLQFPRGASGESGRAVAREWRDV